MKPKIHKLLTYLIAGVWLINGLFAKVLNFVPRHEQIVSRILGETHSEIIVKAIGFGEVLLAVWVLSGIFSRLNAAAQIFLVAAMNVIEFVYARDLLLWGGANAIIAFIFIGVVYYNEFVLGKSLEKN
ncbi:MAG TPA: DoxX-like family protein [Pyrinomonadaceae bacterium]|nr:DoxX-like family protein [Pyrinomonadaceae bacterium]